ncbi:alanine dehydrogenase [Candidatus Poriferisodalis sp.]|uniref:alanine dehydrogenase n=1 Tax=Candidatus Poriferisodalis sp. TaxID=3101277 RepID=UPI003B5C62D9
MIVGLPRETKSGEQRVGLTPDAVGELVRHRHRVIVESGAGTRIGSADSDYEAAGAEIAPAAPDVWRTAELMVKVKEPQPSERKLLRPDQILFAYLHLAPDPEQAADLLASGAACIAYETVSDPRGGLPLLAPMSRVAGRLAVQAGAWALEKVHGGAGILIGGVPGVPPARVVIIGGGVVGENAAQIAIGMGADVRVLDIDSEVLGQLDQRFGTGVVTVMSTRAALDSEVIGADLVIGAVLVTGARAPSLVTVEMIRKMRAGSVVVDVAIDQGGCIETSRPTTHAEPTFIHDRVVHYCVANMPGAVPLTATRALSDATLPRVLSIADQGLDVLRTDPHLRDGLNVYKGRITKPRVAAAIGVPYTDPLVALG